MSSPLRTVLVFTPEDQAWLRRMQLMVPDYWRGHGVAPIPGDVFRVGGRQFTVQGRLWEHEDPEQVAFEMFGVALGVHHHRRLLGYDKARARALDALERLFSQK